MSLKDRTTLLSEIATYINDNTANDITAEEVRQRLLDLTNSYPNLIDDSHLLGLREYEPTKTYLTGFSCVYNGSVYKCTAASTTGVFDAGDWEELTPNYLKIGDVNYRDLNTASTTQNINIYSLPAGYEISDVWRRVTVAFVGAGVTALSLELGVSGESSKYGFAQDMLTTGRKASENKDIESDTVATDILAAFTATGANLDQLTAGQVEIYATIKKVF